MKLTWVNIYKKLTTEQYLEPSKHSKNLSYTYYKAGEEDVKDALEFSPSLK